MLDGGAVALSGPTATMLADADLVRLGVEPPAGARLRRRFAAAGRMVGRARGRDPMTAWTPQAPTGLRRLPPEHADAVDRSPKPCVGCRPVRPAAAVPSIELEAVCIRLPRRHARARGDRPDDRAGRAGGDRRPERLGQVDAGPPAQRPAPPDLRPGPPRWRRHPGRPRRPARRERRAGVPEPGPADLRRARRRGSRVRAAQPGRPRRGARGTRRVEALAAVGLDRTAEANPYDLGYSRRKLLALASVLAMGTPIVVLDEPTTGPGCPRRRRASGASSRGSPAAGRTVHRDQPRHALRGRSASRRVVVLRAGRAGARRNAGGRVRRGGLAGARATYLEPTLAAVAGPG